MKPDETFLTEQEAFWAGNFGNDYIKRNKKSISSNLVFFSKILAKTVGVRSAIEFGANIGLNLKAIHQLLPNEELSCVEINENAANELKKESFLKDIYVCSILNFLPEKKYDLCLTKGVLIHINPEKLKCVYNLLYNSTKRYILIAEYYNPTPVGIVYREHKDKLFKRDFAGELLDLFKDLSLVDYGFCYHRDPNFPQDDLTWFLLEKK